MLRFALHPPTTVEPATGTTAQVTQQIQPTYSFPSSSGKPDPGSAVLGGQGRQPEPGSAVLGGQGRPPRSGGFPRVRIPRTPVVSPGASMRTIAPPPAFAADVPPPGGGAAGGGIGGGGAMGGLGQSLSVVAGATVILPSMATALQNIGIGVDNVSRILTGRPQRRYVPYYPWLDRLYDRIFPNHARSEDALLAPRPLEIVPPFYGGQSSGVLYNVSYSFEVKRSWTTPMIFTGTVQMPGAIRGTRWIGMPDNLLGEIGYGNGLWYRAVSIVGFAYANGLTEGAATITGVNRVDGQPDTGGNVAPAPGATRPEGSRAPSIAPSSHLPAPRVTPSTPIPNNPTTAQTPRTIPKPAPSLVPTAASPHSPLHPKNLRPSGVADPLQTAPETASNPVAPSGQNQVQRIITGQSGALRMGNQTTTAGQMLPNETAQDYISRLHTEQLQRFEASQELGFTNPFENLTSNILETNPATATETTSINPAIVTIGAVGLLGAGVAVAARTIPSGLQNTNPTRTGNPTAPVTARPTQTRTQTTFPPEFPTTGGTSTGVCSYDSAGIAGKVDTTNATLGVMQTLIQEQVLGKVTSIDNKMGSTALTGGVTGFLSTMGTVINRIESFSKKTWNFLQVDRIISFLTFITTLHNAYMLSAGLTQTLFSAISTALDATGLDEILGLVDSDDEAFDVGATVNKLTDSFFKSIFGVQTVDGIKESFVKLNRIYQSAMNVIYTVNSIVDSTRSIVELVGENVGKIGNALKRSGAIFENSFGWMQERLNGLSVGNNRWEKMFTRIEQTENVLGSMSSVSSEVISIHDNINQLKENRTQLRTDLASIGFGDSAESTPVKETESGNKTSSASPTTLEDPQVGGR